MSREWIADGRCLQHSEQTMASKRFIVGKFLWWLTQEGCTFVGKSEIRGFLAYVGGPAPAGGRWSNPHETGQNRPRTVHTYAERLRTLFRWGVREGTLDVSPMGTMMSPVARRDEIQPFMEQQVDALLSAARQTRHPLRDTALCLFMLDTACRASEVCSLTMTDLDIDGVRATVLGKGNKRRPVYFDGVTAEALRAYLATETRRPGDPVFSGERGRLTRSGLQQMVERLGEKTRLTGVRCSPHTFRHTAAVWAIRNGMNAFSLQQMLGHTDLAMTRRYVAIAQADVEEQHRRFSPVLRLPGLQAREEG